MCQRMHTCMKMFKCDKDGKNNVLPQEGNVGYYSWLPLKANQFEAIDI